jgi:hypothetical protein
MSITRDAINNIIDDMELTEDDAFSLVYDLANKYGWATSIWSMGDIQFIDENGDWVDDDEKPEITDAMKFGVESTWSWRKGINEIASERVYDMIPRIQVHSDGSFTVHDSGDEFHYTADGGTP